MKASGGREKKSLVCTKLFVYSESRLLAKNRTLQHLFSAICRMQIRDAMSTELMCSFAGQKTLIVDPSIISKYEPYSNSIDPLTQKKKSVVEG